MYLLRKLKAAALRFVETLAEQFEPLSPADRELRDGRASLSSERVRRSKR